MTTSIADRYRPNLLLLGLLYFAYGNICYYHYTCVSKITSRNRFLKYINTKKRGTSWQFSEQWKEQNNALRLDYRVADVRTVHYVLPSVQRCQTEGIWTRDTQIKAKQYYRLARVQWNPAGNPKQIETAYVVICVVFHYYCEIQLQKLFNCFSLNSLWQRYRAVPRLVCALCGNGQLDDTYNIRSVMRLHWYCHTYENKTHVMQMFMETGE